MLDDPSAVPEEFPTDEAQEHERLRLFALISELVTWENTTNEQVLNRAREEIKRSWRRACTDNADHPEAAELFDPNKLPGFHDPFAGGGALPLEAQRLGLEAYASDLNPVAVLINKAMIEIPPKFAGLLPVNPEAWSKKQLIAREWKGAEGLAEDVRYYGNLIREKAFQLLRSYYPAVVITSHIIDDPENPRPDLAPYRGRELRVIAWLWARTVNSPNPFYKEVKVPLISNFVISAMNGREAYVHHFLDMNKVRLCVRHGAPLNLEIAKKGTKLSRGASFRCCLSGDAMSKEYVRKEFQEKRDGTMLMAIVAEGDKGRVYISPTDEHEDVARLSLPDWKPTQPMIKESSNLVSGRGYGIEEWHELFTPRQNLVLSTLSRLTEEIGNRVLFDYEQTQDGSEDDCHSPSDYRQAICTYLSLTLSRFADRNNAMCTWDCGPISSKSSTGGSSRTASVSHLFTRQAIPMTWDFAEANPFSESGGSYASAFDWVVPAIERLPASTASHAIQASAQKQKFSAHRIVSTDPPYYDNIAYAELSDFFYVWLRHALRPYFPDLFATMLVPKDEELVATPHRHGGKESAETFFLDGMSESMANFSSQSHPAYPVTIYYAFRQTEKRGSDSGFASTGWSTFLQALIDAGLELVGTWPVRTELSHRMIGLGTNALASSVVLVCQRRKESATTIVRKDFRHLLRLRLPQALKELERANIAPVDVAQAAIGPGMAIYSSAKAVLNPDDSQMTVREALIEINAALDEYLSQDEGELDADSRFALTFFESFGYKERDFGDAEGLAKARNLSVAGVAEAGILRSVAGKVQLLQRSDLPDDWDPVKDKRLCVWEATQQLIKRLEAQGEASAAALLLQLKNLPGHGDLAANCRALAYRLYNHCEKSKQAEEARAYNGLVIAWPELEKRAAANSTAAAGPQQLSMV